MKNKKNVDHNGIEFWESTSDLLAALLLILLMIIILLFLYLKQIPENDEIDPDIGNTYYSGEEQDYDEEQQEQETTSGGGGGDTSGGGGDEDDDDEEEEEVNDEDYREDEMKAAIYVKVVDSETGKLIPQAGIRFRVYSRDDTLQVLHDYYPEKISLKEFETTDQGDFYLPEKIYWGNYYLKDLSTIKGYMLSPNVPFEVDHSYDWSDPLVVTVELSPYKNRISIRVVDGDDGKSVGGAKFNVVAAEDITGKDGTVRYTMGEIVDTLECDEDGAAISKELYLGSYRIEETDSPVYYAAIASPVTVDLDSVSEDTATGDSDGTLVEEEAVRSEEIALDKSTIVLRLTDESDKATALSGIPFTVTCDADPSYNESLTTDGSGKITVQDLQKNTVYHFKQTKTTGNYRILDKDYTVTVDADGRMDGLSTYTLEAANRLIRVGISVKDKFLKKEVPDTSVSLYNEGGTLLHTWTSTDGEYVLDDLDAGKYYVTLNGSEDEKYEFTVADTGELQSISIEFSSTNGMLIIGGAAAIAALVFALVLFLFIRGRKKKTSEE